MTARRFAEAAVGLLMCVNAEAQPSGSTSTPTPTPGPAATYAPALWLGQEEPFYPMLPHPFAFDGIDNNGDGKIDLADPVETQAFSIRDLETKDGRAAHSRALRAVFGRLLDVRSCVLSKEHIDGSAMEARKCSDAQETDARIQVALRAEDALQLDLLSFRTCGPLWKKNDAAYRASALGSDDRYRCGPDPVLIVGQGRTTKWLRPRDVGAREIAAAPGGPANGAMSGIQYWMYYPWDAGHINDGEHVSVFYWPEVPEEGNRNVKGVVGAGHEGHTSNNILVASKDETRSTISPRSLPRHMPFLVELGKHASAPDFNCNGQYDMGVDSNVAPRGSWGSRDTMVSIDSKSISPFRGWMSVERDASGFLIDQAAAMNSQIRGEWKTACPEFTRGHEVINHIFTNKAYLESTSGVAVASHKYRLVDGSHLADLMKAAGEGLPSVIVEKLNLYKDELWGADRAPKEIISESCDGAAPDILCLTPEGLAAMRTWSQHPADPILRARRDVWAHGDYEHFDKDFKRHLFKQFALGLSPRMVNGNFTLGATARIAGLWLVKDSSLDLGVYFDDINDSVARRYNRKRAGISDVTLTYNAFRTSYYGIFGGIDYRPRGSDFESVVLRDPEPRTVVIERTNSPNIEAFAGVALTLSRNEQRFTLRAGASAPIWRGTLPDGSAHKSVPRVGLLLGVDWLIGFHNEKHPLER